MSHFAFPFIFGKIPGLLSFFSCEYDSYRCGHWDDFCSITVFSISASGAAGFPFLCIFDNTCFLFVCFVFSFCVFERDLIYWFTPLILNTWGCWGEAISLALIQVSLIGCRDPITWAGSCCLPDHALTGNLSGKHTWDSSSMGSFWHPKWSVNLPSNISLGFVSDNALLISMKQYLLVVLIFICLMCSDFEYCLLYLLAIYMSLEIFLFKLFAHIFFRFIFIWKLYWMLVWCLI